MKKLLRFLGGHYEDVLLELKTRMTQAASQMNYEKAALYRDRIQAVNDLMQRQKALDVSGEDRDIIAALPSGEDALVHVMLARSGRLISAETYALERAADEEGELPPGPLRPREGRLCLCLRQ